MRNINLVNNLEIVISELKLARLVGYEPKAVELPVRTEGGFLFGSVLVTASRKEGRLRLSLRIQPDEDWGRPMEIEFDPFDESETMKAICAITLISKMYDILDEPDIVKS